MKKTTLSQKLFLLCLTLLSVVMAVGAIGYFNLSRVSQDYSSVILENFPKQRMALEMMLHFQSARVQIRTLGLRGLPEDQAKNAVRLAEEEISTVEKLTSSFAALPTLPGEEKLFHEVEMSWTAFKEVGKKILDSYREGDNRRLLGLILVDCPEHAARYKTAAGALISFHYQIAEERSKTADANAHMALRLTLTLMGLGLLMGVALAVYLARSIARDLLEITIHLSSAGGNVSSASESLAAISQQLASASQEQASSVEEVSSSLEEISGMVSATVQGTQNVLELVNSGNQSMAQLQGSVQEISDSNSRVEQLVKLIEEIGEKTELIDEIVFQTRLLSFNASVEAERAGEHGRGFAVVAQEVGNLAQMSGKSASEISQIVKGSIKTAQEVAQLNRSKVDAGATLCKETAQKLDSIQKAAHEILNASKEQNSGIQQINQSIQLISKSTEENASSAEVCSENSTTLNSQVSRMAELVEDLRQVVTGERGDRTSGQSDAASNSLSRRGSEGNGSDSNILDFKRSVKTPKLPKAAAGKIPSGVRPVQGSTAPKEDAWDEI